MAGREQRKSLLGNDGFEQITEPQPSRHRGYTLTSPSPNDATIDIPLTNVQTNMSKTGSRKAQSFNEKTDRLDYGHAGRRRKIRESKERGEVNPMGKIYKKILGFSIVTRYFLYLLPMSMLIAVPIVIGATVSKEANFGDVRIGMSRSTFFERAILR